MGSMAPDWRVVGATPGPDGGSRSVDPQRPLIPARQVGWALAALLTALVVGAMTALLLMPGTGDVVIASGEVDGAWTGRAPGAVVEGVIPDLPRALDVAAPVLMADVEGAVARPGLVTVP